MPPLAQRVDQHGGGREAAVGDMRLGKEETALATMLDVVGREFGIRRLLLEGGGGINGSFFAARLVGELSVPIAPSLDGRSDTRAIVEAGDAGLAGKQLSLTACEVLEHGTVHLRYVVRPS